MSDSKSTAGRLTGVNAVDLHVGQRIRIRRSILGISQNQLADAIGVRGQQIQKYEKGTNRLGASRLYDIANLLNTDIQWFFDEMPDDVAGASPAAIHQGAPDVAPLRPDMDRATTEIGRLLRDMNQRDRHILWTLARCLANGDPTDSS